MNKHPQSLSELSNEELWQLFPIILSEYRPEWKERYLAEKNSLESIIGIESITRINHYGSTSVPNLIAKPTIDILLEVKEETDIPRLISAMEQDGYIYSPQPNNPAPHMMFMKGYTSEGFKGQAYHIHVRYPGDWDELYFRDYLCDHPEAAQAYGELKQILQKQFQHDRDAYTSAKTDFIREKTAEARKEFPGRYTI